MLLRCVTNFSINRKSLNFQIKIFRGEQAAIVEMRYCETVERCIRHLSCIPVGNDKQLEIKYAFKNFITVGNDRQLEIKYAFKKSLGVYPCS